MLLSLLWLCWSYGSEDLAHSFQVNVGTNSQLMKIVITPSIFFGPVKSMELLKFIPARELPPPTHPEINEIC